MFLPLGRLARVRILARGLPTVCSEGRQITLLDCINMIMKPKKKDLKKF